MKLLYYIIFTIWYLLSLLPLSVLYLLSDLLYIPLYYGIKYRRKVVRTNLTNSFPEKTKEENSLLGQILLFATGVLLFASVMVFASVLGRKEKALAENTGKPENNRKKTQQKTKKTNKK